MYYDEIVLDTVAPTGSIIINSGNPPTTSTTAVTLYLTYFDATSGVYEVRYSNDGVWDSELWEAPTATKSWTLTSGPGLKTVYYQVQDNAFLLSTTYSDTITLSTSIAAYLVVRGMDNGIWYRSYDCVSGTWGTWNNLPGATLDSPGAAVCQNQLHIVVRGMDGSSLWHGYLSDPSDKGSFTGWTLLSGATDSAPTLTSNGTVLSLVVRGLDNRIYYRCYSGGSWNTWFAVPTGATGGSPSAAMLGNDLHVVVRGMDGTSLWHTKVSCDGTGSPIWTWISGATNSKPALTASQSSGKLYLVVRGLDDKIYYRDHTASSNTWGAWNTLPGATIDAPAVTYASSKLYVVVRGSDGNTLWHWDGTGWTLISGATPSAPTLTS